MRRLTRLRLLLALLVFAGLAGCASGVQLPQALPTSAAPVGLTATPTMAGDPLAEPEPTAGGEASPVTRLAGAGGTAVACAANTQRLPLVAGGHPVAAASRIVAAGDMLYVLADGALYRLSPAALNGEVAALEAALATGGRLSGPVVQELTDLAYDEAAAALYALDKAGHLYRADLDSGVVTLDYRATNDPDQELTEQMLAVTVDDSGRPVLLDSAFGALWTPADLETLELVGQATDLTEAVDVEYTAGRYYVLLRDGSVVVVNQSTGAAMWRRAEGRELTLSLWASDALGAEALYLVDALGREVVALDASSGDLAGRYAFAFPDMGLLRDAALLDGRLFALADGDLYVYPGSPGGPAGESGCPPLDPGSFERPRLYGEDVLAATRGWQYPIRDGTLPVWPRVYPGASRLYRQGVHHGLDIYYWDGPEGFSIGTRVTAPASGQVVSATVGYVPVTGPEFDRLIGLAHTAGYTPPDVMARLEGKRVELDHGDGIRTAYLHLDLIAGALEPGAAVRQGQFVGTVGVTGTEGEGRPEVAAPHLHLEIWVGDRYLGQGITLTETMWWFEQVFGG